jgi:hypothetical protein
VNSAERQRILERGIEALRAVLAARVARLPPPEHEDADALRAIRELDNLATGFDHAIEHAEHDADRARGRDAQLSGDQREAIQMLGDLANDLGLGTPYREGPPSSAVRVPLTEMAALLRRYQTGEFMPPDSYFGIEPDEA